MNVYYNIVDTVNGDVIENNIKSLGDAIILQTLKNKMYNQGIHPESPEYINLRIEKITSEILG